MNTLRGFILHALINPIRSMTDLQQRTVIEKSVTPREWFVVGHDGTLDDLHRLFRKGRVWVVAHIGLLADQKGTKASRVSSMVALKIVGHSRGSVFLDASTSLRSDKDWHLMLPAGEEMCRRLAQGSKSALNGAIGRHGYDFDDEQLIALRHIALRKFERDQQGQTPDEQRLAAIADLCRRWEKPPVGRSWMKTKLPALLSERGLRLE